MGETVFTDEQVTSACNLHVDNLRRLITWGAVKPVQGGGGRGRVRLWSFAQAMRVATTAEFFEAGFSLQMAHTLSHCLPLDDMLRFFDPLFIKQHVDLKDPREKHVKRLLSRRGSNYWLPEASVGSEIIIIDRRIVYADVLGDDRTLFGIIDPSKNLFYPTFDPKRFLWGMVSPETEPPPPPTISKISRASLLIERRYFEDDTNTLEAFLANITRDVETQINDLDEHLFRNYLKINLNVGLVIAFRKLLGLPVVYEKAEERING